MIRDDSFRPFRPASRLHQPAEYRSVVGSALRFRSEHFEVRALLVTPLGIESNSGNASTPTARLGMIIPKRLAHCAVIRNRIKRLIRESFRNFLPALPIADIVVKLNRPISASKGCAYAIDVLGKDWRKELDRLFRQFSQRFSVS